MLILSRFIALALMMFAMAIASIAGFQTAQNPQAAQGVAVIGLLIIAFCAAFAIFGIVLGAGQAFQQRLDERRDRSRRTRPQLGQGVFNPGA